MPTDIEVREAFSRGNAYGYGVYHMIPTPRLRYILQEIEHAKRSKFDEATISPGNLTIEHIMPRSWAEHWPLPNGSTAPCEATWGAINRGYDLDDEMKALMDARNKAVDALGNLTLITNSLNPSIGNAGWEIKRARLRESLLVLNREITSNEIWDEAAIERRANDLAKVANSIWKEQGD